MATLVLDPRPAEIDALIEYRRRLDLDHYDEVWEGVLHINPPPTGEHQYVLQRLSVLLWHVVLALVQHGQAHHMPGHGDGAHLLHLEDPAGGDPGPRADRVEPEVDARRYLLS